jgi:TorA maturation chaperone TorD
MNIDKQARTEYVTLNKNRAAIYKFLSKVYETEVTTDFLRETSSEKNPLRQVGDVESIEPRFKEGLEAVRGYLSGLSGRDLEHARLELAAEYASLFLGLAGKPAHPSESAYFSESHSVMGEARDEVLGAYRNAGLDKIGEYKEPEDHIAIELSFMEYLCRRTADSVENDKMNEAKKYLEMQRRFISEHLALWVPMLAKDILESAELEFYKGIAKITDEFIKIDRGTIHELVAGMEDI